MNIISIKYQRTFKNESLTANEEKVLPIPDSAINQHRYFNDLTCVNVSSNDILVTPDNNSDRAFLVPAKGNINWSFRDDNFKYSYLKYKNLGGTTINSDNIYFIVIKKRLQEVRQENAEY